MTIERYTTADNKAAEKFSFTLHILDKFEGMDQGYKSYNDYISGNIYGQLVERVVDHFITVRTIDDLTSTSRDLSPVCLLGSVTLSNISLGS